MFQNVLSAIEKHVQLSPDDRQKVTDSLKVKTVKRKDFLLTQGSNCKEFFYVNTGILRAFHLNEEGKEATIMFAVHDWWITDMACFIHEKPAQLSIQVVEDGELLCLSKSNMDQLFVDVPAFESYFRIIMQNAYIREQSRTIQNLSQPASERYENFITKYPQVASKVTQKQIASYLGITPEFLSTIRGNKN